MIPIPKTLKNRNLLRISDFTPSELKLVIEHSQYLKSCQYERTEHRLLIDRTIALLFEKPSTRTRVSFAAGIAHLGGSALNFSTPDLQLGNGESLRDTALVLSRYVDGIVFRTFSHAKLEQFAESSEVPVINGLTDTHHPCQALADALTIQEHCGSFKDTKIAFLGDGENNVCHSLIEICSALGGSLVVASPSEYMPAEKIRQESSLTAATTGAKIEYTDDAREAATGADVLYTDVWISMGRETEIEERRSAFVPFGIDESIFSLANDHAVLMHCLPARIGEEITEPLLYGPQSAVWDQAENRMHAQKALLSLIIQ